MSASIFPLTPSTAREPLESLPLYRDIALDPLSGTLRFSGGEPVMVEGQAALLSWAYRTLHTARYRYAHLSWDIGTELEALVGKAYREDTKRLEAERYVRDALLVLPYIQAVEVSDLHFAGTTLTLTASIKTVYGKETIYV